GCFMTGKEVEAAVNFVKENNNYEFDKETELSIISPKQQSNACDLVDGTCGNSFDEFMEQALKLVIENGQASITILQRKLLIGYPRAARIIDQMETAGFISPSDGSKPRSVYMTMEEWEKLFNKE
ncbi:MAG: DNA translocase FtsK, partial [Clostridia bacterium]